ncbi:MAG: PH domain-containing protein [Cyclonatronaceae bacterium]
MSNHTENTYSLQPDWQHYFIPFVIAMLLIPVLFIGMFIIYYYRTLLMETWYHIGNDRITRSFRKNHSQIMLSEITDMDVTYNMLHKKFGLGNVHIRGAGKEVILEGVSNPVQLVETIQLAVDQIQLARQTELKPKNDFEDLKTGAADQMNYLVGLWQQGLITNEDYELERKKYVRKAGN